MSTELSNHVRGAPAQSGFTLLELVVVMGLLSTFLLLLVQLVSSGAKLFDEGESGQDLADRTLVAHRAVELSVDLLAGPVTDPEAGEATVDARMIVHRIAGGVQSVDGPPLPEIPVLRATVSLTKAAEERLLREELRDYVLDQVGQLDDQALEMRVDELITGWPRRGRGEMLLLPWPLDESGEYFELRRRIRLSSPEFFTEDEYPIDALAEPRDLELDVGAMRRGSEVIATGLLHFDIELWSQRTTAWNSSGQGGPERVWDSARAGIFLAAGEQDGQFGLDKGFDSLRDARDDVFPRWIRVTMVVGRSPEVAPDAYLTRALGREDRELMLDREESVPGVAEPRYLKIGSEWVRFADHSGGRVDGLVRGVRGTTAVDHPSGTPVRVGRTLELYFQVPHGKDSDV